MFPTRHRPFTLLGAIAGLACLGVAALPVAAAETQVAEEPALTYADLVTLADVAPLVVRARVTQQATLKAERAPGLAPGHARLYVEADTISLLAGTAPLGGALKYLVDVPLDSKGRPPKLKKKEVVLFARAVPSRPGELQLVAPDAQLVWSQALEARLRPILSALASPDAPPRITKVRDALSSEGNLAGESETQVFLQTANDAPAALTVIRRPGMEPRWGVSFEELVDQSAAPAARESLAWYRLACALPAQLPQEANISESPMDQRRAAQDYAFVMTQLGPCTRTRS